VAFDGNGNYVRLYSWVTDKTNGIDITSSRVDAEDNGFAAALSLCVTRDGQGKMAANFLPLVSSAYSLGSALLPWGPIFSSGFKSSTGATQAFGAVANAFVDLTPDTSTFTATYTGFSGSVQGTATWSRIGNQVMLTLPGVTGTSNATSFAVSGLPPILLPVTLSQRIALPQFSGEDNSVAGGFDLSIVVAPTGVVFAKNGNNSGFTASGTKGIVNGPITVAYHIL